MGVGMGKRGGGVYRSIIVIRGETTRAVVPAARTSDERRHGRAVVFQVGFWRERSLG